MNVPLKPIGEKGLDSQCRLGYFYLELFFVGKFARDSEEAYGRIASLEWYAEFHKRTSPIL
jgi:hypothetical protein